MQNKPQTKKLIIAGSSLLVVAALATIGIQQFFIKPNSSQLTQPVVQKNKENAAVIREEEEKESFVITDETMKPAAVANETSTPSPQQETATKTKTNATVTTSGASTNLDRPEIRPAVVAVLAVYQDFLEKMKAAPLDQRQAVADQYFADNSSIISPTFNYASSTSIHLLPQSANLELPDSITVNSAINDPDDSSQKIVQIFMPPDPTWSVLVFVRMNDDGTLKTIEKIKVRQNQNPL